MRLKFWPSPQAFFYTVAVFFLLAALTPVLAQSYGRSSQGFRKSISTPQPLIIGADGGPHSVTSGDWNGDGNLDLATANVFSNSVSVFIGSGQGQFSDSPQKTVSVGNAPVAVVSGDWNHDRRLDLVTANKKGNNITVLLGDGVGSFQGRSSNVIAVGKLPVALATGDWNTDGDVDLVVVNGESNSVTILLGNGNGRFQSFQKTIAVGTAPRSVTSGDWDRDGDLDLVVANEGSNTLTLLRGDGRGGFTHSPYGSIAVGAMPRSVTSGDWDGDGNLDLAVANVGDNSVTVLNGNGYGVFTVFSTQETGGIGPGFLVNGDWDGNGMPDLAIANRDSDSVTFLLGNGRSYFQLAANSPVPVGDRPISITSGDWDNDGDKDLAVADLNSNDVTVLFNPGQSLKIR